MIGKGQALWWDARAFSLVLIYPGQEQGLNGVGGGQNEIRAGGLCLGGTTDSTSSIIDLHVSLVCYMLADCMLAQINGDLHCQYPN